MNEPQSLLPIEKVSDGAGAMTPGQMLDKAITNGAAVEIVERLMALQERWQAGQARKAYFAAMADARKAFRPLGKAHSGYRDRYKYETLDDVIDAVGPALTDHGFSYTWKIDRSDDGLICVSCIITHAEGHAETTTLPGDPSSVASPDANMNGVQRIGATVTYLQRYTLKAACGIAATADTDGKAPEKPSGVDVDALLKTIDSMVEETKADVHAALTKEEPRMTAREYQTLKAAFNARLKRIREETL